MSFTKILYLAIFSIIFLLIFIVNGCSYPTNYKAFVPKALDSDYKEYQRLCKEEIGKVIYARPVGDIKKETFLLFGEPKISDSIKVILGAVRDRDDNIYYI